MISPDVLLAARDLGASRQPFIITLAEVTGGFSALGLPIVAYGLRFARRVTRALDKVEATTTRELTHNGGNSTKDMTREARDGSRAAASAAAAAAQRAEEAASLAAAAELKNADTLLLSAHELAALRRSVKTLQTTMVLHMHDSSQVLHEWNAALDKQGVKVPPVVELDPTALDIADAIVGEVTEVERHDHP